ncbi:SHD1 domain-containing protein [Brevifollis gellanilyticus]|uniref:SLA1 homology domain-containing protein n=1 Tax=Brevifollis gellanilyticus TaxID=748831 RepID=A0A512M4X7_9BACT|nr:SHD1 domain-containing protein [Brevifollis gellanilyticus]GEP41776.1 hypothetical protein BGE01nite_10670 [Brevifollis gellanilyticus]
MKVHAASLILTLSLLGSIPSLIAQAAAQPMRLWTNQQGRTVQASLVEISGANVVLQLQNGTKSNVAINTLGQADQEYLKSVKTSGTPGAPAGAASIANAPLAWPAPITVNTKTLVITPGDQDEAKRNYHYQSGPFEFIAKAPLAGTVMREVAGDFELTHLAFNKLPWGWKPKPEQGDFFKVYLTETDEDFIELGGIDGSAAGSKDDYVFIKFTSIGLKKVGAKYAYDAKQKDEGQVVGMTSRLMIGDMRILLQPWSALGLEKFMRTVAYHNGGLSFTGLESELKTVIKLDLATGAKPEVKGLVEYLRAGWDDQRSNVKQIRIQNFYNGLLLVYYFGFLEGDGSGARLHQYYRDVAQAAMAERSFRETDGKSARPPGKTSADLGLEFLNKLLAGRTDDQLKADMITKFRGIGVKFDDE